MNRCSRPHAIRSPRAASWLIALSLLSAAALLAAPAAQAQHAPLQTGHSPQAARTFPQSALYGTLVIIDASSARLNGKRIGLAPGLRLYNQHHHIVPAAQLAGQRLRVRYQVEVATGMVQTAWVLRDAEMPPRRLFGLFGPATQDPHEVQPGPLGVGTAKNALRPASASGAHSGYGTITGHGTATMR